MANLRHIVHPGPPAPQRIAAIPCRATRHRVTLRADMPLLDAMSAAVGGAAAWFDLTDLDTAELAFVRPAPAPGDGHVAWYSATTTLPRARILAAGAHLGRRDGAPFAHVHGLWADRDGHRHAGHLLADATCLARDTTLDAFVIEGAHLESTEDPETRFRLFQPVDTARIDQPNAVLATVRPNEIIDDAIRSIARTANMAHANVKGLGSLVGTRFDDQDDIASHATEVLLTSGHLSGERLSLGAVSVGIDGPHAAGTLLASCNTVCVTFELLLLRGHDTA